MRILFVGDVVGRPGRRALKTLLPGLRRELDIHLVVANGENAAGGYGITRGPGRFNSVLVDLDEASGRAETIQRVDRMVE